MCVCARTHVRKHIAHTHTGALDARLLDILYSWTSRYILKKIINQFSFSRMDWRWRNCFSQGYFPKELKFFLNPRYFGLIESVLKMAEDNLVSTADAMNDKDQLRQGVKKLCGILLWAEKKYIPPLLIERLCMLPTKVRPSRLNPADQF